MKITKRKVIEKRGYKKIYTNLKHFYFSRKCYKKKKSLKKETVKIYKKN